MKYTETEANLDELIKGYIRAVRDNFVEPTKIGKGDKRVLFNGEPLPINFRILSEENYQLFVYLLKTFDNEIHRDIPDN